MLAPPFASSGGSLRVLYYCHDSYGLGHLRRTLRLARHVRELLPDATQLVVSGAAYTDGWSLPAGADWVKLPSVVKVGADEYRARSLECGLDATLELRKDLVLAAARRFAPDIFVVDHVPAGLGGEALPALRQAAAAGASLVLGLRDVLDDATLVRRSWRTGGVHALLDRLYDRIVVYGDPSVYDVVEEYGFSPAAAAKTRYVGYLRAPWTSPAAEVRRELGLGDDRLVVVTAGGGGDGFSVVSAALAAFAAAPLERTQAVVVPGPLMDPAERAELEAAARRCGPAVRLVPAVPDLGRIVAAADAVISMGGYNTVCEILSYGRPAVIVPRVRPRLEQLIRAEALAGRGLVRVLHPVDLTPARISSELRQLLDVPPRRVRGLALDGLDGFVSTVEELAQPAPALARSLAHV